MEKPKLLLDENIGRVVAERLRAQDYDVKSVAEEAPGTEDAKVLDWALRERRIVVTLDKDFGHLVFYTAHRHGGVIFLRLKRESAENIFHLLSQILIYHAHELQGKFITATDNEIRLI